MLPNSGKAPKRGGTSGMLLACSQQKDEGPVPGFSRRTLYVMQSASSIMCRVSMDMPCPDMVALIWSTILARAASMPCSNWVATKVSASGHHRQQMMRRGAQLVNSAQEQVNMQRSPELRSSL